MMGERIKVRLFSDLKKRSEEVGSRLIDSLTNHNGV